MTVPGGYLLSCLLVWAWQSGHWAVGVALGLVLEASRRGAGEEEVRSGVWGPRLCALVSVLGSGVVVLGNDQGLPVLRVFEWLPVLAAPWLLWQYRRCPQGLPAHWWGGGRQARVQLDLVFALGCLLAASLGNRMPALFALALLLLAGWLLYHHRPRNWRWQHFLLILALSGLLGGGFHQLLVDGQTLLESRLLAWVADWWQPPLRDPDRQTTALGHLGRLKQSSRIVIRLGEEADRRPRLLMQASYNVLVDTTWFARQSDFRPGEREAGLSWRLDNRAGKTPERLTLIQDHAGERTLLALPAGSRRLTTLPAETLLVNQYGAAQAVGIPRPVRFQVEVGDGNFAGAAPAREDHWVPTALRPVLDQVIGEAGLAGLAPTRMPAALKRFFTSRFSYSLRLDDPASEPLERFLSTRRSGHCEYFASATVFLLRRLGIPARYATGYSVQEFSPLEGRMVARQRHAHAWALAFLDGQWRAVDTTPPDWLAAEAQLAPWWSDLADLWSWLRWELQSGSQLTLPQWLGGPLLMSLALTWLGLRWRRWLRRPRTSAPATAPDAHPGMDSECYKIVDWCRRRGLERPPGQTLRRWLPLAAGAGTEDDALLGEILALHYRYRFDPAGLSGPERRRLGELSACWLARRRRLPSSAHEP